MRKKYFIGTLAAAAAMTTTVGAGGVAYAVTAATSAPAVIVTGPDHQRLTFTLAPGHIQVFKLPATNDPVRIDLDEVSTNGGVQTPSEVFSALVNADANKAGMSWIGTNSDGSQVANSTIRSFDITNLMCGAHCVIAWLNVASVSGHTVVLKTNSGTSIIREKYVINIWY